MARNIFNPTTGVVRQRPLQVTVGGTGLGTKETAVSAMGGVSASLLDAGNGVATTDSAGRIKQENIPVAIGIAPNVQGPVSVYTGVSSTHKITNYDMATSYAVSGVLGSVTLSGDTLTYVANSVAGVGSFTVNGCVFPITVMQSTVTTPAITSPVNNATEIAPNAVLTSTAYTPSGSSGAHASSTWQLSTRNDFATIAFSKENDTVNLTSATFNNLPLATTYYARVRYTSVSGIVSDWSAVSVFTVRTYPYATAVSSVIPSQSTDTYSYFGETMSMTDDGNTVVIGEEGGNGAASVYVQNNGIWTLLQKLDSTNPSVYADHFGADVAITSDGRFIVVGAYSAMMKNDTAKNTGAAMLYTLTNGRYVYTTVFVPGWNRERYGWCVAISNDGTTVVIGSKVDTSAVGQIAIYRSNTPTGGGTSWREFTIPGSVVNALHADNFGHDVTVSTDGTFVFASSKAYYSEYQDHDCGSMLMWNGSTYVNQQYIDKGTSLASSDDFSIIAISLPDIAYPSSVAIYKRGNQTTPTWTKFQTLLSGLTDSSGRSVVDKFGQHMKISNNGDYIVITHYFSGVSGQGGAQVWHLSADKTKYVLERQIMLNRNGQGDVAFSQDLSVLMVGVPFMTVPPSVGNQGVVNVYS